MAPEDSICQYEALTRGVGLVALGSRTQIELLGRDRTTFLHNLCTNDIRKLPIGQGCETFFTNVQGKVLAHVHAWAGDESLIVETVPGLGEKLLAHLDRYLIREQVELVDRSQQWTEFLLGGAKSVELLARCGLALEHTQLSHRTAQIAGFEISLRRVDITLPAAFLLSCAIEHANQIEQALEAAGAIRCGWDALEMARLETGFPWYGQDISEENLAPEVGRDPQAISYVKGCYLGQETIARIDALGHVNRMLVGVGFETADAPSPGTELFCDGKGVGRVTSAAFSPKLQAALALAYVRRGHHEPGSQLSSAIGRVGVVKLPL
jgi:folate-binding protein YgfZ